MDRLEQYRQFIEQILTEHAQISTSTDTEVKTATNFRSRTRPLSIIFCRLARR